MKVAIIIGSVSDFPKVAPCLEFLDEMQVSYDLRALSAHRMGEELREYISQNDEQISVYIAAAGKAAHLPGVIASQTIKPIIGIPIKASALEGMDALLSIVQMPPGVPVATVAIDGAKNAAILACQMLALGDKMLADKLVKYKDDTAAKLLEDEKKLLESLKK